MTTWQEVDHQGERVTVLWNDKYKVMSVISWNPLNEAYLVSVKHPLTQRWLSTVSGDSLNEAIQLAEEALASGEYPRGTPCWRS